MLAEPELAQQTIGSVGEKRGSRKVLSPHALASYWASRRSNAAATATGGASAESDEAPTFNLSTVAERHGDDGERSKRGYKRNPMVECSLLVSAPRQHDEQRTGAVAPDERHFTAADRLDDESRADSRADGGRV